MKHSDWKTTHCWAAFYWWLLKYCKTSPKRKTLGLLSALVQSLKNFATRPTCETLIVAQWLPLHSRDGFLLANNMWCWNSCWVGSALLFPVSFTSNPKKEAPIGVPGTSIRSVPTLTGEGINTHTHTHTDPILFKLFRPNFEGLNFFGPNKV